MVGFIIIKRGLCVSMVALPRTTMSPRLIHCIGSIRCRISLRLASCTNPAVTATPAATNRLPEIAIHDQKQDRRQQVAEQLPEGLFHRCLPFIRDPAAAEFRGTPRASVARSGEGLMLRLAKCHRSHIHACIGPLAIPPERSVGFDGFRNSAHESENYIIPRMTPTPLSRRRLARISGVR